MPAANSIKNGQDEKPEEMVTDTEPVKLNKREKKEKRSKKKGKKEEKNKAEEENEPSRKKKKGKKRKLSEEEEMEWSQSENVSPEETPGNGVDAECSPTKKKKGNLLSYAYMLVRRSVIMWMLLALNPDSAGSSLVITFCCLKSISTL